MKLARFATGRPSYIAFIGAFHGRTFGALSLTASKASQRRRFAPLLSSVFHAPFPTVARGITTDDTMARLEELFTTVAPPESVAAVFVEPIQGGGGYLVPPDDFLPRLRELTLKPGILMVADEVQSGMGRTGHLLSIEHWGVEPDLVCLAKGIASGLPLGAFIARAEQMNWPPGSHGSTFGGNPVACAAGLARLDLLEDGLMEHAARVGAVRSGDVFGGLSALIVHDLQGRDHLVAHGRRRSMCQGGKLRDEAAGEPLPGARIARIGICEQVGVPDSPNPWEARSAVRPEQESDDRG